MLSEPPWLWALLSQLSPLGAFAFGAAFALGAALALGSVFAAFAFGAAFAWLLLWPLVSVVFLVAMWVSVETHA